MWHDALSWLREVSRGSTGRLVGTGVALIVLYVVVRRTRRAAAESIEDASARYHTRKVIAAVGFVVAALIVGAAFSNSLTGLPLILGVTAAGIALALQEVVTSTAGWLSIAAGSVFKPGDRIQLGGVKGDVIDIGVLRTTLMEIGEWVGGDQYSGRIVRVGNSAIFKAPVYNYSANFPFVWDEIKIPIRYGSDRVRAREILEQVADEVTAAYQPHARAAWKTMVQRFLIEDARVDPMIMMTANDNWIEYTLRYTVDFKLRRSTRDRLFNRILDEIDATRGAVSIASETVEVLPHTPPGNGSAAQITAPESLRTGPGRAAAQPR